MSTTAAIQEPNPAPPSTTRALVANPNYWRLPAGLSEDELMVAYGCRREERDAS